MIQVVVDTNIFVSAALRGGTPREVVRLWEDEIFTLVVSSEIVDEYMEVLSRPKFRLSKKDVEKVITLIDMRAVKVFPTKKLLVVDDPKDNKFLECASEANANYIVSGDKHLKDLGEYEGIKIVSPEKFFEIVK